ncbi:MAG TPA: ABC transporter permease [Bacillota bacterium]|nr:ABC transporter permease [Bacillota bacterium]
MDREKKKLRFDGGLQKDEKLIVNLRNNPNYQIWRRLCRNKISVVCMVVLVVMILAAIFADFIRPKEMVYAQNAMEACLRPSWDHPFGTDCFGRDLFTRVLYGSRISFMVGFTVTIISTVIGSVLGGLVAYYGGTFEEIVMRITDMFMAIPEQLLAICVVASFGANAVSMIVALSIAVIPVRTRLMRSTVLSIIDAEYVEAARACGMSDFKIIVTEIMPNAIGPTIINCTQGLASIILTASSLSYLGVGIQPPTPEWGAIISEAKEFLRLAPYYCILPGVVMVIMSLSFNLLGDGLRDAMDPRLKD